MRRVIGLLVVLAGMSVAGASVMSADRAGTLSTSVRQVTFGPRHHFFGYFGHVRTCPWNASGRYLVALETGYQDRMPQPGEAADIVLLDVQNNYAVRVVEQTRAWNFQQGTMLYWNPEAPETQVFFNDRDPETRQVVCVRFDISRGEHGERVREYRFADQPIGNSGIAQHGGWFLGINYGRLDRLRPVTGYPGAYDWTAGREEGHPSDDGVFKVNAQTGEKELLVSFAEMADVLRVERPDVDGKELFINHTLWSRDDARIYFYARGDFEVRDRRLDVPFTMRADGTELRPLSLHIGGHPEWESDRMLIGVRDDRQILFDVVADEVAGLLTPEDIFPKPGGDIALSADGSLFVNGHGEGGKNYYTVLRRSDGAWTRSDAFNRGEYTGGPLRIDPSPNWNRDGTQLMVVALDAEQTRQMFVMDVRAGRE